jgi:hypothetical protein
MQAPNCGAKQRPCFVFLLVTRNVVTTARAMVRSAINVRFSVRLHRFGIAYSSTATESIRIFTGGASCFRLPKQFVAAGLTERRTVPQLIKLYPRSNRAAAMT